MPPSEASSEADIKRLKLCYQDPSINVDNVSRKWAELLSIPHPPDQEELITNIMEGNGNRENSGKFIAPNFRGYPCPTGRGVVSSDPAVPREAPITPPPSPPLLLTLPLPAPSDKH